MERATRCGGSTVLEQSRVVGWVETIMVARLEDKWSYMWRLICEITVETQQGFVHTLIFFLILRIKSMTLVGSFRCGLWTT